MEKKNKKQWLHLITRNTNIILSFHASKSKNILWLVIHYVQATRQYLKLRNLHLNKVHSRVMRNFYLIFIWTKVIKVSSK